MVPSSYARFAMVTSKILNNSEPTCSGFTRWVFVLGGRDVSSSFLGQDTPKDVSQSSSSQLPEVSMEVLY